MVSRTEVTLQLSDYLHIYVSDAVLRQWGTYIKQHVEICTLWVIIYLVFITNFEYHNRNIIRYCSAFYECTYGLVPLFYIHAYTLHICAQTTHTHGHTLPTKATKQAYTYLIQKLKYIQNIGQ